MIIAFLFWLLAIASCGYAALRGGRDGRLLAALYLSAIIFTIPAQLIQQSWTGGIHWPVFIVELYLLGGLYWLSMRTERYWPLWVAGFQLIVMSSHLAAFVTPSYASRIYFGLSALWSVPQLLVLIVGVVLDRRSGFFDHDDGTTSQADKQR